MTVGSIVLRTFHVSEVSWQPRLLPTRWRHLGKSCSLYFWPWRQHLCPTRTWEHLDDYACKLREVACFDWNLYVPVYLVKESQAEFLRCLASQPWLPNAGRCNRFLHEMSRQSPLKLRTRTFCWNLKKRDMTLSAFNFYLLLTDRSDRNKRLSWEKAYFAFICIEIRELNEDVRKSDNQHFLHSSSHRFCNVTHSETLSGKQYHCQLSCDLEPANKSAGCRVRPTCMQQTILRAR